MYQDSAGVKNFYYIHTDYLGSWLSVTDNTGSLKNRYSYDAWGRPRSPSTWALMPIGIFDALINNLNAMQPRFDRGYTGHEQMAGFGLINMNGRLYDPYLQRFLSPDNVVQAPDNAQNYNRYSYCLNNPLMYTDPSGWQYYAADYYISPDYYNYMEGASSGRKGNGSGGAGYGLNGDGLNGVYYDWYTHRLTSVEDGSTVSWDYTYNNCVKPYATFSLSFKNNPATTAAMDAIDKLARTDFKGGDPKVIETLIEKVFDVCGIKVFTHGELPNNTECTYENGEYKKKMKNGKTIAIEGFYLWGTNQIYISPASQLNPNKILFVVAHEIVHYLNCQAGLPYNIQSEHAAYQYQERFAREYGWSAWADWAMKMHTDGTKYSPLFEDYRYEQFHLPYHH